MQLLKMLSCYVVCKIEQTWWTALIWSGGCIVRDLVAYDCTILALIPHLPSCHHTERGDAMTMSLQRQVNTRVVSLYISLIIRIQALIFPWQKSQASFHWCQCMHAVAPMTDARHHVCCSITSCCWVLAIYILSGEHTGASSCWKEMGMRSAVERGWSALVTRGRGRSTATHLLGYSDRPPFCNPVRWIFMSWAEVLNCSVV
jgi:hypothetical protein